MKAHNDDKMFVLINFDNSILKWIKTLCELDQMLGKFSFHFFKKFIFAGDYNLSFESHLETSGGNLSLKTKSIPNFMQVLEKFDIVDIWRIRNPFS